MVIYFILLLSCNTKHYINCLCTPCVQVHLPRPVQQRTHIVQSHLPLLFSTLLVSFTESGVQRLEWLTSSSQVTLFLPSVQSWSYRCAPSHAEFYVAAGALNSGPHTHTSARTATTSPTKTSPEPYLKNFKSTLKSSKYVRLIRYIPSGNLTVSVFR